MMTANGCMWITLKCLQCKKTISTKTCPKEELTAFYNAAIEELIKRGIGLKAKKFELSILRHIEQS